MLLKIPTGFRQSAQSCEQRATLGKREKRIPTLKELCPLVNQKRINDNDATRVGVVDVSECEPKVAPSSQPWAESWNPVGIQTGARTSIDFNPLQRAKS